MFSLQSRMDNRSQHTCSGTLLVPVLPPHSELLVSPATPVDFINYHVVPPVARLLADSHPHMRDQNLVFRPQGHTYLINDVPSLGSVTALVGSYSQGFNAEAVIRGMVTGHNWPRPGYLKKSFIPSELAFLWAKPEAAKLRGAMLRPDVPEEEVCCLAQSLAQAHPHMRDDIVRLGKSAAEIQQMWDANRREGANRGTWMHLQFEMWLNRIVVPADTPEMHMFLQFIRSLGGLTAFRTEWGIYGDEERLAGTIDFVARDAAGDLLLFDWKRTKQIASKYTNVFKDMREPLEHLEDCAGSHYRLQLNCYKYLLEKYYGYSISGMFIVCTHPDNGDSAFVDKVPVMSDETEQLMQAQRRRAVETACMQACDAEPIPSPTQMWGTGDLTLPVDQTAIDLTPRIAAASATLPWEASQARSPQQNPAPLYRCAFAATESSVDCVSCPEKRKIIALVQSSSDAHVAALSVPSPMQVRHSADLCGRRIKRRLDLS